jgi:hypothetical protein
MLNLDRPATYQIKVPGDLGSLWPDLAGKYAIQTDRDPDGTPITTLTGTIDQAGLQGLLRELYSLGLPILSVFCTDRREGKE